MLIKSIRKYGKFYEDSLQVEYPTGSGNYMNLEQIADEISLRVIGIFTLDQENGRKYIDPAHAEFYKRPENRNLMQFFEYFHGDSGLGLGASHQTGWTALVAELIDQVKDRLG